MFTHTLFNATNEAMLSFKASTSYSSCWRKSHQHHELQSLICIAPKIGPIGFKKLRVSKGLQVSSASYLHTWLPWSIQLHLQVHLWQSQTWDEETVASKFADLLPSCKMIPGWYTIGVRLVYDWYTVVYGDVWWYTAVYGGIRGYVCTVYDGIRRYTGLCVYGIRLVYDGIRCTSGYGIRLVYGCCTSHVTLEGSLMKTVEIILAKHVIKLKPRDW